MNDLDVVPGFSEGNVLHELGGFPIVALAEPQGHAVRSGIVAGQSLVDVTVELSQAIGEVLASQANVEARKEELVGREVVQLELTPHPSCRLGDELHQSPGLCRRQGLGVKARFLTDQRHQQVGIETVFSGVLGKERSVFDREEHPPDFPGERGKGSVDKAREELLQTIGGGTVVAPLVEEHGGLELHASRIRAGSEEFPGSSFE